MRRPKGEPAVELETLKSRPLGSMSLTEACAKWGRGGKPLGRTTVREWIDTGRTRAVYVEEQNSVGRSLYVLDADPPAPLIPVRRARAPRAPRALPALPPHEETP